MSRRAFALVAAGIVLIALAVLLAYACQPTKPPAPVEYTTPQTVEETTAGATHEATQEPTTLPDTSGVKGG